jgi:hypothetical protein
MKPMGPMVVFAMLTGCEDLGPCELAATVDEPGLVIGLGEEAFREEIASGRALTPSYGQQGGQHLWLAVRTFGFAPGEKRGLLSSVDVPTFLAALVGVDDGVTWVEQGWNHDVMEGDPTRAELALGEFVVSGMPAEGLARPLLLRVRGTDACGTELADEVEITLEMEGYGSTY